LEITFVLVNIGKVNPPRRFVRVQTDRFAVVCNCTIVVSDYVINSSAAVMLRRQVATVHVIDLPGSERVIRTVEFRYGNLPGGGRAQAELWAQ